MRTTILLLAASTLVGCTTMETVQPDDLPTVLAELKAGDRISARVADSWQDFVVVGVSDASIRLESRASGESITLAREQVSDIRVLRRAPGKAAALAAGIYFGALYLLCGNPFVNDGC